MNKTMSVKKLEKACHELGKECGSLGVKLFYKSITPEEASKIQTDHCKKIFIHNGMSFAKEVYKTVYLIMTTINTKRQKKNLNPLDFYTDGMDKYFQGFSVVNSYDD